ncbi:hypothetical protein [Alkalicoccobacillus murimartini]|uniref:Uncharacterized protein n=1 Tax=Alkalicoccobacillus murimartini TaxID=171685 RepID=A0ABT9YLX1_9BACI|nr:hypothetical protein [Alkalicoccobacillus murimartini]MDQ0208881.1 hypothetical protein [Alkalicoccobacillus murimartini]
MSLTKEQLKFVKGTITREAYEGALQHEAVMLRLYTENLSIYLEQLNDKAGTLSSMIDNLKELQLKFDQAYKTGGRMSNEKYQELITSCKAELQQVKRE